MLPDEEEFFSLAVAGPWSLVPRYCVGFGGSFFDTYQLETSEFFSSQICDAFWRGVQATCLFNKHSVRARRASSANRQPNKTCVSTKQEREETEAKMNYSLISLVQFTTPKLDMSLKQSTRSPVQILQLCCSVVRLHDIHPFAQPQKTDG